MRAMTMGLAACVLFCGSAWGLSASATDITVDELDHAFSTRSISIKVGDALIFDNKDSGPHSLTIVDTDGDATQLAVQLPGKTVRAQFAEPGEFKIRCTIAPDMRLMVDVGS